MKNINPSKEPVQNNALERLYPSSFEQFIKSKNQHPDIAYVDKTLFLKEFIESIHNY